MRPVKIESSASESNTKNVNNVIGVDESGNVTSDNCPSALVAVRCPRSKAERLAEILIDYDLHPWDAKSSTLLGRVGEEDYYERVECMISALASERIYWKGAAGYHNCTIKEKSAAVCTLSKGTILSTDDFDGKCVIVPDGNFEMYGKDQSELRKQATQTFDGSFQSTFGEVYISAMARADLTYPEATAADHIASWIRKKIENDSSAEYVHENVTRFNENWCEPDASPQTLYTISNIGAGCDSEQLNRIIAWITGKNTSSNGHTTSFRFHNRLEILESDTVREYLADFYEER